MASHALVRVPTQNSKTLLWLGNAFAWPLLLLTAIEAGGENNLAAGLWTLGMCSAGVFLYSLMPRQNTAKLFAKITPCFIPMMLLLSWGILRTSLV